MTLLAATSAGYLATAAVGTALAVRKGMRARPLWISTGRAPASDFVRGLGTGLSAPAGMLLALAVATLAASREDAWGAGALRFLMAEAVAFVAGSLVEPVTWRTMTDRDRDNRVAAVVVLNTALPTVLLGAARRELARRRPVH